MNDTPLPAPTTNPFATRWVRPGAIEYHFPLHDRVKLNADGVIAQLAAQQWWGAIIGPHGSGKSTLLALLIAAAERVGRRAVLCELHDGQRRLSLPLGELGCDEQTLICVDGYEQLSRWNAWWLRRHIRRRGAGLLVTAHTQPVELPPLVQTGVSLELAQRLVAELVAVHPSPVTIGDVAEYYQAAQGNLRELFFALYDLHEQRSRQ